jgi:hypothetical protein
MQACAVLRPGWRAAVMFTAMEVERPRPGIHEPARAPHNSMLRSLHASTGHQKGPSKGYRQKETALRASRPAIHLLSRTTVAVAFNVETTHYQAVRFELLYKPACIRTCDSPPGWPKLPHKHWVLVRTSITHRLGGEARASAGSEPRGRVKMAVRYVAESVGSSNGGRLYS